MRKNMSRNQSTGPQTPLHFLPSAAPDVFYNRKYLHFHHSSSQAQPFKPSKKFVVLALNERENRRLRKVMQQLAAIFMNGKNTRKNTYSSSLLSPCRYSGTLERSPSSSVWIDSVMHHTFTKRSYIQKPTYTDVPKPPPLKPVKVHKRSDVMWLLYKRKAQASTMQDLMHLRINPQKKVQLSSPSINEERSPQSSPNRVDQCMQTDNSNNLVRVKKKVRLDIQMPTIYDTYYKQY